MNNNIKLELTILMPCLNEEKTLKTCIQKASEFLKKESIIGEILIADNGSTDHSPRIAKQYGARVISVTTRGYGAALHAGIKSAQGRYIIMGDADGSYDFSHLMPFLQQLRAGKELVMGNRFQGGIMRGAMPFLNRYLGNPILSLLGRLFFKSPTKDFHSGLRGFNRESILGLNLQTNGMEYASEMVVKASLRNLRMDEVPIILSPDRRGRKPHLRPWRDGWRHLKLLLLLCPRWLFMYPGLALIVIGLVLMSILGYGPIKIANARLDIHTMLFSSMFIIVGMQALFFFIFAKLIVIYNSRFPLDLHHRIIKFSNLFTFERGVVGGVSLILLGCLGSSYAFYVWMHNDFGDLVPTTIMRILIPSFTIIITGMQIIFSAIFISILKINYQQEIDHAAD